MKTNLFDWLTSYLPLIVTVPFTVKAVEAASVQQQTPNPTDPSQLLIQALYVFGAALLGWAARRLQASWKARKEKQGITHVRLSTEQRIRAIEARHSVEMKQQDSVIRGLQNQLDSANLALLEMQDKNDIQEKAIQDLIVRMREMRSQEELARLIILAIKQGVLTTPPPPPSPLKQ